MDAPPSSAPAPPANGFRSANSAPDSEVPAFARLDAFAPIVHDAFPAQAPSETFIAPSGTAPVDLHAIMGGEGDELTPPSSPRLPPSATPTPSSSRTRRLQTEKSHDSRTGKATKSKSKTDELSPADRDAYVRVGLDPHSRNDSAAEFRLKVQANEPKMLHYTISGERTSAEFQKDTNKRLLDIVKLINEVKTASERPSERQSIATDPDFVAVHNALTEARNGVQQVANDVSSLRGVPAQLQTMQKELDALKSERGTIVPAFTPLSLPNAGTAAGVVSANMGLPVNAPAAPGANIVHPAANTTGAAAPRPNVVHPSMHLVHPAANTAAAANHIGGFDHDQGGVTSRPAKRPPQ
ncbi:hypothetical protein C8R43DRAFT_576348 [Mycena crocata]|nr:hypothetical protein C8R43DRAFT_576348 [Mycena crocata]